MMKARILPVIITAAISATLLFGGWNLYNQVAVAAPLAQAIQHISGIASADKPILSRDEVTIKLKLEKDANLREVYEQITTSGAELFGSRKVILEIDENPNEQLDTLWNSVLFDVAEAMETKAYSNIPEALNTAALEFGDITVKSEMNDSFVFIILKNSEGVKYEMLPRIPAELGVWSNEKI